MIASYNAPPTFRGAPIVFDPAADAARCGSCPQTLLLREGNHRIANSLQLASSTLFTRARHTKSEEARAILTGVANDIHIIARMHRRLCQVDSAGMIDLGGYIGGLCADIGASALGEAGAAVSFDSGDAPIYLEADKVVQIGLIVTELLTNCMKHAGPKPVCRVSTDLRSGNVEVTVSDDGPGRPGDFQLENGRGVGMQIMLSLASGMNGKVAPVPVLHGACFLLTVPLWAVVAA